MDNTGSNASKQAKATENDSSDNATDIGTIVTNRAAQCRNSVLASQIQKAIPAVSGPERGSLHIALQQLSETTLIKATERRPSKKEVVTIKIPRKSLLSPDVVVQEEYIVPGSENKLLRDSFVRNLAVTIQEKRHYRNSIAYSLKKKPWYTELHDFSLKILANVQTKFELWRETLKIIEGQHGAAVVSYFVFIRWLLYMNIIIFLLNLCFLVVPQIIFPRDDSFGTSNSTVSNFSGSTLKPVKLVMKQSSNKDYDYNSKESKEQFDLIYLNTEGLIDHTSDNITNASSIEELNSHCQFLYSQQIANNSKGGFFTAIQNFLQGTGPLEPTLLFLGFYSANNITPSGYYYQISLAFLCILLISIIICLIMMIRFTSTGILETFLAHNKRSNYYSNEVFSAWDYCIDKSSCANQQHYQFVLALKTSLSDDRAAKEITERSTRAWAKLYAVRFWINIFVILWLLACYFLIYQVTVYQMNELQKQQLTESGFQTLFIQFLSPMTIIILNSISPVIFCILVSFEKYQAQMELNISLIRNLFLYLSSIIVLLNTFYLQTTCKPKDICGAGYNDNCRSPRCWETYIGQQLFKLSLSDMFVYIGVFLGHDTVRNYMTKKFDNKVTRLWGMQQFFLPTEVLAPVNSQTILWLGVFYSPLLPAIMILKLVILFYIKKIKVLIYCEPSACSYRASRSNAVFILTLMVSFFTVLIVHSYALDRIPPSRGCGPFRHLNFMTEAIPEGVRSVTSILMSSWTIIIATFILCTVIYYYWGIAASQIELAKRLKTHLVLQSHDKQFLLQKIADLTELSNRAILK